MSLEDENLLVGFLCLKNSTVQKPEVIDVCLRKPELGTCGPFFIFEEEQEG